jgi:hypothetical protein
LPDLNPSHSIEKKNGATIVIDVLWNFRKKAIDGEEPEGDNMASGQEALGSSMECGV